MKISKNFIFLFLTFAFASFTEPTRVEEIYSCESGVLKIHDKKFECDDLNNYFLNEFSSNYLSKYEVDENIDYESQFIKNSSFIQISDWLGIYKKQINGENLLITGFPDQRMKKDSTELWNAFNKELNKITESPFQTNNLKNGFDSSIFEDSI